MNRHAGSDASRRSWIDSQAVRDGRLDAAQIDRWRRCGFTLVHGLLPDELLRAAAADAARHYPPPGPAQEQAIGDFGSEQHFVFPSASDAANRITLHPALLRAVGALLDEPVSGLRLTQSDLWPKYGKAPSTHDRDNADQRMHCDYPNHTLTHPPPWDRPDAVEAILYLSDLETCAGATALVPRTGDDDPAYPWPITATPGVGMLPYLNDRARAEAWLRRHAPAVAAFRAEHLYPRERHARYRFGSLLLYRHDVWHRGTPVTPGALRLTQNLTFKRAGSDFEILHPGWAWSAYRPDQTLERLVASATVEQRCVLGFPPPGAAFWTAATVAAVEARYAGLGMDMGPYRAALDRPGGGGAAGTSVSEP